MVAQVAHVSGGGVHAVGPQLGHQRVSVGVVHHEAHVDGLCAIRVGGDVQTVDVGEALIEGPAVPHPGTVQRFDSLQLLQADRGLDVPRLSVVDVGRRHLRVGALFFAKALMNGVLAQGVAHDDRRVHRPPVDQWVGGQKHGGAGGCLFCRLLDAGGSAVVDGVSEVRRDVVVVGGDHGAGERGDVLREAEGVVRMVPDRAHSPPLVAGPRGLRAVLDDLNVVLLRDGVDGIHVARGAEQVRGNHRLGVLGDRGFELVHVDHVGVEADVGKDRLGANQLDHGGNGEIRDPRNDHFVALADSEPLEDQVQPVPRRRNHDPVFRADEACKRLLEFGDQVFFTGHAQQVFGADPCFRWRKRWRKPRYFSKSHEYPLPCVISQDEVCIPSGGESWQFFPS